MKALRTSLLILLGVILIAFGVLIVKKLRFNQAQSGISLPGEVRDYPYSGYSLSDGKVYYNKPGSGYFLVKDADAHTFRPLNTVGDIGTMARDTNHVFFKTNVVPGLKIDGFVYLGNNFCRDHDHIFYGNILLKGADISSFAHLYDYYASDKKRVYYKQNIIPGANAASNPVQGNLPDEYLADGQHVYYKGMLIQGAKPAAFKSLVVEDDSWHTQYAFDGEHYFYQQYKILTDKDDPGNRLQLLSLDKGFGWHGIFYQGTAVYCYDTDRHQLVLLGNRDNSSPFKMIDRGIFTDDRHVYFTFGKWDKAGGRMPGYTGHTTGICVVEGADPRNFKAAGKLVTNDKTEGIIYVTGNGRYFHPTSEIVRNYHPGLLLLQADGLTADLPIGKALSKSIKNDDETSVFSKKFYQDFFKPDSDYRDY